VKFTSRWALALDVVRLATVQEFYKFLVSKKDTRRIRLFNYFKRIKFILKFWRFIPFLKEFFFSREVAVQKKIIGLLLILAYALFPFDLIPDFLSLIGIVDDVVIATFVLERMINMAPESLKDKYKLN
jgi:uncharacterized membrane protein YkvA (DUF1232 family)